MTTKERLFQAAVEALSKADIKVDVKRQTINGKYLPIFVLGGMVLDGRRVPLFLSVGIFETKVLYHREESGDWDWEAFVHGVISITESLP